MSLNMDPKAYLVLEMTYPSAPAKTPLSLEIRDYHRRIEDEFLSLADGQSVQRGTSSGSSFLRRDREWWSETMTLRAMDGNDLRIVAERTVHMIRKLGIQDRHQFRLRLRVVDAEASGEWRVWVRRVYPARGTAWQQKGVLTRLRPHSKDAPPFPVRLGYLAGWAGRCMG